MNAVVGVAETQGLERDSDHTEVTNNSHYLNIRPPPIGAARLALEDATLARVTIDLWLICSPVLDNFDNIMNLGVNETERYREIRLRSKTGTYTSNTTAKFKAIGSYSLPTIPRNLHGIIIKTCTAADQWPVTLVRADYATRLLLRTAKQLSLLILQLSLKEGYETLTTSCYHQRMHNTIVSATTELHFQGKY